MDEDKIILSDEYKIRNIDTIKEVELVKLKAQAFDLVANRDMINFKLNEVLRKIDTLSK